MMDIFMLVAGAGVGAMLRDLFVTYRGDMNKDRQQIESKTPYDYALTNAINERDRLQDELRTIHALKRTEADTERIRNEIGTILSDAGEESTESAHGGLNGIPIVQHSDGTISPFPRWDGMSTEEAAWDAASVSRAYANANVREDDTKDEQSSEDDVERSLINEIKDMASENLELAVEFAKMTVQDDEAIRKQLEETSKELAEEIRDVRRRMREFREGGKYYGERLTGNDVEHSLTKAVRDSFENREIIRVTWRDSYGSLRFHCGRVDAIATGDGKVKEFGMRGLEIFAGDVIRITKGDYGDGETLYRKGNR